MKILYLFLTIISILLFTQAAAASGNLVTESAPVNPGDTIYVYVPIQNVGFGTFLNDVSARLEPKDNASANAVAILDDTYSLGSIENWGDQRTARFKIHINPNASEGDYFFNVFISYRGQQISPNDPAPIVTNVLKDQILTIRGKPVVVLLNSTLGIVEPMSVNKETLKFKNTGTGTVQNAIAEIDLTTSGSSKSSFSILGAGTQFSLGNLEAGDEAEITFDLAVDITATPGVYNLPLRITGLNNYSSDNFVGLVVAGTTNFEISYQESLGSFSLNVLNTGISPASSVAVILPRQKNFSTTGSSSSVLGNLNPGDYTSAIFQVAKIPGSDNTLEVDIHYTDTSGKRHMIAKYLQVELSQPGAQSGVKSGTNYTQLAAAGFAILVIFWQRKKITKYFRKQKDIK